MKLAFVRSIAPTIDRRVGAEFVSVEDLKSQFDGIDTNNDDTISKDELRKFLVDQDQALSDKDFEVLWRTIDIDGKNEVDFTGKQPY